MDCSEAASVGIPGGARAVLVSTRVALPRIFVSRSGRCRLRRPVSHMSKRLVPKVFVVHILYALLP